MNFLSPWSALLAAAIAIPALLLLYLLKLRRQPVRIPSTMLWKQTFRDLQANVPFQKLRYTPLLLIQLLLLLALLLAYAQPVLEGDAVPSGRIILLIDVSASMQATDGDDTQRRRLDSALDEARDIINAASRADTPTQIMIAIFGSAPRVITSFESNRRLLLDALDAVQPTDETADLDQALQLAGAFASRAEDDQQPPQVTLISDGGVGEPKSAAGFELRSGAFRYVRVGPPINAPVNNIGITAFTARRDYDNPAQVSVFARLTNTNPAEAAIVATVTTSTGAAEPIALTVPGSTESGPGERSFTASLELPDAAVITLRHNHHDALDADDVAAMVLPPPRRPVLAMVHPDSEDSPDRFIFDLLEATDPQQLDVFPASDYARRLANDPQAMLRYDMILFDRVAPQQLPAVPTLTFGAVPPALGSIEPAEPGGRAVLSWDRQHPLMQYVELDPVRYSGFGAFELPTGATPLAWGPDGPIIATFRSRGASHVAVGFALRQSNWPLQVSFAVFVQNAFDQLMRAGAGLEAMAHRPGEPITVQPAPDADSIRLDGPTRATIDVDEPGPVTIPPLRLAGLYDVTGAQTPMDAIAVSMLSDQESDIRPKGALRVNAQQAEAVAGSDTAARPLWPWLVAAALALAVVEWLVWCLRARSA